MAQSINPISGDFTDDDKLDGVEHVEESGTITWTPEEEKKLVRKIDLFLMPTIWLMYLLSYMDRTK